MQNKKEKLIEKIVKKNYNNELEEILENKEFEENVKNLLLNLFYKIEAAYKDVETVKRDVKTKEEYIQSIIEIIKNNCDNIKIVRSNSEEAKILGKKTFLVQKDKKQIISYPIERKVLYAIAKIEKNDTIIKNKYFLIHKTLSDLINVGNNISMVEPLRDFNGFSWTTIPKEIESIEHNIIYQNLRMLVGNEFLNNWIQNKEFIIDYMELFKNELDKNFGKRREKEIIKIINKISILLYIKFEPEMQNSLKEAKKDLEEKLEKMQDREKFIEYITEEKRNKTEEIRKIDTTINNKELLKKEYLKRNETLPLEKKIFSIRILSEIMIREREKIFENIDELNKILNPQNFIMYKQEIEEKIDYLKLLDIENKQEEIEKLIIKIQKLFLICFTQKIIKAETKNEIIELIYSFRYYVLLPLTIDKKVIEEKSLNVKIQKVIKMLVDKAHEYKVINILSNNQEINFQILKNLFTVRIIKLEDIILKITKEKEKIYVQFFDENIFEEKIEIKLPENVEKGDLEIKFNKKMKLFN